MHNRVRLLALALVILIGVGHGQAQPAAPILEYGRGLPRSVVWSPEGDQLLVVTQTGTLWRYDANTFETIDNTTGIKWAAYSASGDWLFTESPDDRWAIRHADAPDQVVEREFAWVRSEPGTGWLLTNDASGTAIRPEADPEQIALGGLETVVFSPDHQQVLTRDPESGYLLRTLDLAPLPAQPNFPDHATSVQWSPDEQQIAMVTSTDEVTIVPLPAEEPPYTFTLPDRERYATLVWSPDSTRLLDYDSAGNAHIWDTASGDLLIDLPSGDTYYTPEELALDPMLASYYWALYWSADSSHLFRCAVHMDTSILCHFYDAHTGEETGQAFGDSLLGSNFTPDKRYFIISSGIFDANTGAVVEDFSDAHIGGYNRVYTPDSRRMATSFLWSSNIVLYDLDHMQVEHTLHPAPYLYDTFSMTWSLDGERLVTWGSYGTNGAPGSGLITVWDADTGTEVERITDHVLFGQEMTFSPDSSRLAAADSLGNVAVFETANGNLLHTLSGHSERVSMLAWQPGGDLLATTTGRTTDYTTQTLPTDGTVVQVWDTRSGNLVATLEHERIVFALLWHPSGRYLITDDNTGMSIWGVQSWTREQIPEMSGNSTLPYPSYRWTDDGNVLIRGHYNCSGGGRSLNFFNFATRHTVGPIHCAGDSNYEWNAAANGILLPQRDCRAYATDGGYEDCRINVLFISTELPNDLYRDHTIFDVAPVYSFGQFEGAVEVFRSPDNGYVAVVTDTDLQMWRLGRDSADRLWTGEPAQQVEWNHSGNMLVVVNRDEVSIVDADTGAVQVRLMEMPLFESVSITWSPDDAYLWVSMVSVEDHLWVFDAASGERVPFPDEVRPDRWVSDHLQVYRPDPGVYEWWDVRTGHIVAAGDQLHMVVSDDGRFGVETRTGVLRVWPLGD